MAGAVSTIPPCVSEDERTLPDSALDAFVEDQRCREDGFCYSRSDGRARVARRFWGACSTFSTFGYVNSWGYSMIFVPALVSGWLFDRGHLRVPFFCASLILIAATFLVG
ncbi:hypothetical protein C8J57DRAFT_1496769 [Mycena rebaudengoi]|nr:hypothetical protein C8J57DRAFT_1496769 [Mycena rebaudengoi]